MRMRMRMRKMNKIENNELLFIKTNKEIKNLLKNLTNDIHSLLPHIEKVINVTDQNQLIRARNIAKYDTEMRSKLDDVILNHSLDKLLFNINEMNKIINIIHEDE